MLTIRRTGVSPVFKGVIAGQPRRLSYRVWSVVIIMNSSF